MDFLKNNWCKMVMAVLVLTIAVFAFIMFINAVQAGTAINTVLDTEGLSGDELREERAPLSAARSATWIWLGVTLSSLAGVAFLVMKMVKMGKVGSYVLIGGGAVATILVVVGMILGADHVWLLSESAKAAAERYDNLPSGASSEMVEGARALMRMTQMAHFNVIAQSVTLLIAFGLLPLAYGLKKVLCCCKKDAEKPAVQE